MASQRTVVLSTRLPRMDAAIIGAAAAARDMDVASYIRQVVLPVARQTVRDAATEPAEQR